MFDSLKEPLCAKCIHRDICSVKNQYIAAQKAVEDATVDLKGDRFTKCFVRIRDIDWIEPVQLQCVHYILDKHA